MKVYFYYDLETFKNSYLIGNKKTKEAILIDPRKITKEIIEHIEKNEFDLKAVLITHEYNMIKIKTLLKIYNPTIYAASSNIKGAVLLTGDTTLPIAGFSVHAYALTNASVHTYMYQIGDIIFVGKSLSAGILKRSFNTSERKILREVLKERLLRQNDSTILLASKGPPTTLEVEKQTNTKLFIEDLVETLEETLEENSEKTLEDIDADRENIDTINESNDSESIKTPKSKINLILPNENED